MKKILVIGAGTMGSGIAQAAAQAGYQVYLRDIEDGLVEKGMETIDKNLNWLLNKGKINEEDKVELQSRIKGIVDLTGAKDADLAIEAIVENMAIKKKVFQELDKTLQEGAVFASNTSSLSITELAVATGRPDKVIGMHFFNPVAVMQLVEVIKGVATSEKTYNAVETVAKAMGKQPVAVNEAPGFVVNRILVPMMNEAAYLVMEGVSKPKEIDAAMKLGANHPIGPLALADLIGLDVCLAVMEVLHEELGEDKYRPCPLLRKMVRAGQLGRKTGKGFHQY